MSNPERAIAGREKLLRQLSAHRAADANEEYMRQRMAAFVAEHVDCFSRALLSGHVTGSAWILDLEGEHVLLTHHNRLDKWMQLGGHADGELDALAVALREACEESGLMGIRPVSEDIFDVDVHEIPARAQEPAHYHYDVRFLFVADRSERLTASHESKALAWVALAEIESYTREESVLRMAHKSRGRIE